MAGSLRKGFVSMMTLEEMKKRKHTFGYTNEMIAEKSGMPLDDICQIFSGDIKMPDRKTLLALEAALQEGPGKKEHGIRNPTKDSYPERRAHTPPSMLEAPPATYGAATDERQGSYTIADYDALPDERRVELIDGYFYDMASPSTTHQALLGNIYAQFLACMNSHPECELFMAPLDVRLGSDENTIVQPDLLIICNRTDNEKRRINGAPDFVLEILSPTTRYHDQFRKLNKYRQAGVREYWIVDPEKKTVTVYPFLDEEAPETYSFEDIIPVRISGHACRIDFSQIHENVKRYL